MTAAGPPSCRCGDDDIFLLRFSVCGRGRSRKRKKKSLLQKNEKQRERKKSEPSERERESHGLRKTSSPTSLSLPPVLLSFSTFSRAMTAPVASTSTTSLGESLQRACPAAALSSSSSSSSLQQQQLARHRRHRRRSFSFFMLPALLLLLLFCIASPTLVLSRSEGAPCELWPGEKLPPVYARCGNDR